MSDLNSDKSKLSDSEILRLARAKIESNFHAASEVMNQIATEHIIYQARLTEYAIQQGRKRNLDFEEEIGKRVESFLPEEPNPPKVAEVFLLTWKAVERSRNKPNVLHEEMLGAMLHAMKLAYTPHLQQIDETRSVLDSIVGYAIAAWNLGYDRLWTQQSNGVVELSSEGWTRLDEMIAVADQPTDASKMPEEKVSSNLIETAATGADIAGVGRAIHDSLAKEVMESGGEWFKAGRLKTQCDPKTRLKWLNAMIDILVDSNFKVSSKRQYKSRFPKNP